MARTGLGLGVRDLAHLASVSTHTITRFEGGAELKPRTIMALQGALEAAGATFLEDDGSGHGVRLRNPAGTASDAATAGN
ncbi:transcriptional regulator [Bradyrhizobium sp. P5_C11_2]